MKLDESKKNLIGCEAINPVHCQTCDITYSHATPKIVASIDFGVGAGLACEIAYYCIGCKEMIAYWAYGSFDPYYDNQKI